MSLKKLKLSSLSDDDIDNLFLHPRSHQDVERLLHRNLFLLGEGRYVNLGYLAENILVITDFVSLSDVLILFFPLYNNK